VATVGATTAAVTGTVIAGMGTEPPAAEGVPDGVLD
jgi:hypothetical protein